jgi:VanZ family protein
MRHTGTPTWAGRLRFGLVLAVSLVVLFAPPADVPSGPEGADKIVHIVLFAALALSGRYAGIRGRLLVPALIVYGGSSEPLQALVGRSTSLADWGADVLGVLVGYAGAAAAMRARSASRSKPGSG